MGQTRVLILSLGFVLSSGAIAQWQMPNKGCMVRYAYDEAGNRIRSYWYCWSGGPPSSDDTKMQDSLEVNKPRILENADLSVFPTPTSDFLNIKLSEDVGLANYFAYDLKGVQVLTGQMAGTNASINVAGLQAGVYQLVIRGEQEQLISTFVWMNKASPNFILWM